MSAIPAADGKMPRSEGEPARACSPKPSAGKALNAPAANASSSSNSSGSDSESSEESSSASDEDSDVQSHSSSTSGSQSDTQKLVSLLLRFGKSGKKSWKSTMPSADRRRVEEELENLTRFDVVQWMDSLDGVEDYDFAYEEHELRSLMQGCWSARGSSVALARTKVLRASIVARRKLVAQAVATMEEKRRASHAIAGTPREPVNGVYMLNEAEEMCLSGYLHFHERVRNLEKELEEAKQAIAALEHRLGHESEFVTRKDFEAMQAQWALLKIAYEGSCYYEQSITELAERALTIAPQDTRYDLERSERARERVKDFVLRRKEEQALRKKEKEEGEQVPSDPVLRAQRFSDLRLKEVLDQQLIIHELKERLQDAERTGQYALYTLFDVEDCLRKINPDRPGRPPAVDRQSKMDLRENQLGPFFLNWRRESYEATVRVNEEIKSITQIKAPKVVSASNTTAKPAGVKAAATLESPHPHLLQLQAELEAAKAECTKLRASPHTPPRGDIPNSDAAAKLQFLLKLAQDELTSVKAERDDLRWRLLPSQQQPMQIDDGVFPLRDVAPNPMRGLSSALTQLMGQQQATDMEGSSSVSSTPAKTPRASVKVRGTPIKNSTDGLTDTGKRDGDKIVYECKCGAKGRRSRLAQAGHGPQCPLLPRAATST